MQFDLNPLELLMKAWAIRHWRWVPPLAMGATCLVAAGLLIRLVDGDQVTELGRQAHPAIYTWVLVGATVTAVMLYGGVLLIVVGNYQHGETPSPRFNFLNLSYQAGVDTFVYKAVLDVGTPYAVPRLRVIAEAESIHGLQVFGGVTTALTHPEEGGSKGVCWSESPIAAGRYDVTVTTRKREPVSMIVLVSGEVVIREVFRPK